MSVSIDQIAPLLGIDQPSVFETLQIQELIRLHESVMAFLTGRERTAPPDDYEDEYDAAMIQRSIDNAVLTLVCKDFQDITEGRIGVKKATLGDAAVTFTPDKIPDSVERAIRHCSRFAMCG